MDVSLSIPAARFSDLASVTPVSSRALAANTPANLAPAFGSGSSVVELSATGIVLAAVFGFEGDLQTLQTDTSGTAADSVTRRAEGLVTAFNALQENIAAVQSGATETGEPSAVGGLAQTLNALVTAAITGDASAPRGLGSIGITLQAATADGTSGVALGIDRQVLADAVAADTPSTSALLDRTIQSLIDTTAAFESQAADVLAAESGVPASSTSGTTADNATSGNNNSDLAAARNLTDQLLATAFSATAATTTAPPATANTAPAAATPAIPSTATTPADSTGGILPIPTLIAGPAAAAGNPATGIAGANAADREAFAARLALQAALDNPTRRSLEIIFDPAYAALMAATHPGDFVLQAPILIPPAVPDDVQPIVAIRALDRIAAYGDTGGEPRRRVNTTA